MNCVGRSVYSTWPSAFTTHVALPSSTGSHNSARSRKYATEKTATLAHSQNQSIFRCAPSASEFRFFDEKIAEGLMAKGDRQM